MPWSIAECTARDASPTSIEPYMVVLISQVPKPMGEVMRSVLPIGRRSMAPTLHHRGARVRWSGQVRRQVLSPPVNPLITLRWATMNTMIGGSVATTATAIRSCAVDHNCTFWKYSSDTGSV